MLPVGDPEVAMTSHTVQLYDNDALLVAGLTRFVGGALGAGDHAIVIATPAHARLVEQQLSARGLDLSQATHEGRYRLFDAAETLGFFMRDGMPDAELFAGTVGSIVAGACTEATANGQRVVAYGEMVALLYADGNAAAAVELEHLWNALGSVHEFALHCAYPVNLFYGRGTTADLSAICGAHSHVVSSEAFLASLATGEAIPASPPA